MSCSAGAVVMVGVAALMASRIVSRVANAWKAEVVEVFSWPSSRMVIGGGMLCWWRSMALVLAACGSGCSPGGSGSPCGRRS